MHDAFPKRRLWGASLANSSGSKPIRIQSKSCLQCFHHFTLEWSHPAFCIKKTVYLYSILFSMFLLATILLTKKTPHKTADWLNVNRNRNGPGDNRYDLHHKAFGKNRTFLIMRVYRKCHSAVWAEPSGCTAPSLQVAAASSAARVFAVFKM